MRESEKRLSQNIYERGVDDAGFGRIRSKGDQALFGGYTTQEMKERLGVKDSRSLADSLLIKKNTFDKREIEQKPQTIKCLRLFHRPHGR